jgi:hypothetical protein
MKFTALSKSSADRQPLIPPIPISVPANWVSVKITFGDPRKNCSGAGICQVLSLEEVACRHCPQVVVNAYLQVVNKKYLQLIVDKRGLTLAQRKQHFLQAKMVLHTDLLLAPSLSAALSLSAQVVMVAGHYALSQEGHYYHHYVRFRTA